MRKSWLFLMLMIGILVSQPSRAAFSCAGPISGLAINTGGSVYVSTGYGTWAVCAVSAPMGGVAPETCRAWYAGLVAAQKSGHGVRLYFTDGSCESIGNWVVVTPNLYHMDLLDQ